MKNILIIAICLVIIAGCKKKESEIEKTGDNYTININVEDGATFSTKSNNGPYNFHNVIPPSKNASISISTYLLYGEARTELAELGSAYKGKEIEIVVTKSETGELIFSDKKVDKVTATWTAKK